MEKISLNGIIEMNCYIIRNKKLCMIVDPGYEKEVIREYVKSKGYEVCGILLTHGHLDHIGAIDCFDVPVYVYDKELTLVKDDNLNGFNTLNENNPIDLSKVNFQVLNDLSTISLGDKKIRFVHTPGHTAGSVCYLFDWDVYTGDTLFKGSVGRHDFPTGDASTLKRSVVDLLDSLDDNYNIHPGHGESSTVKEEKLNNQFYKMWRKELK